MALRITGIAVGMAAFCGSHFAMSYQPNREKIIEKLGQGDAKVGAEKFRGLYSAVSLATLVPTTLLYARGGVGIGPQLHSGTGFFKRVGGFGFRALGVITLSQAIFTPSPFAKSAQKSAQFIAQAANQVMVDVDGGNAVTNTATTTTNTDKKVPEPKGLVRITRHGMFLSFAILAVGNLFTRGHLSDLLYWGWYPALWFFGSKHQDERMKASGEFPDSFFEETSLIPFQAIWEGKQDLKQAIKEMTPRAAVVGLLSPLFFL